MKPLYILGLVGILVLFMWKKYISYTKQRNQYIQYLQAQVMKLQQVTQHSAGITSSIETAELVDKLGVSINDECETELNCEINLYDDTPLVDVIKVEEAGNRVIVDDEDEDCKGKNVRFETEEDPEKIPLCEHEPILVDDCHTSEDVGKCCPDPLLGFNFVDVPETLFDQASTAVADNDPNTDIKAHNTDDNRAYVPKGVDSDCSSDSGSDDEDEPVDEPQTKQMHCTAILSSGKRKGMMCQRKTKKDSRCKLHA
jgi:hypothetical protein